MIKKIILLLQTVRFLKPIQVLYQLWYRLKKKLFKEKRYKLEGGKKFGMTWKGGMGWNQSQVAANSFQFVNLNTSFPQNHIDWNFSEHGKLWTYNLNYFDWLHQPDFSQADGIYHLYDYIAKYDDLKDGKEPYPTSLRIINWVKYVSINQLDDFAIHDTINQDAQRLVNNLEYHLLANHLLENAFALVFAAYHLQDEKFLIKGKKMLVSQLEEQILGDGAHYELSPMYHQLMLYRVLDTINLLRLNDWNHDLRLIEFLESKAVIMCGWLDKVTFSSGVIPMVNDSARGVNPDTKSILTYASQLDLKWKECRLSDSGYRTIANERFEMFLDIGNIKPSYQPGHAHADSLSFVMHSDGKPFIVDRGTSTYEKNDLRQAERSTSAHNTVTIQGQNSSKVWGGFRVAHRAMINLIGDSETCIEASHDGYQNIGIIHSRKWSFEDNKVAIIDRVSKEGTANLAHYHMHPDVVIFESKDNMISTNRGNITFVGANAIKTIEYDYAQEFNKRNKATKLEVNFDVELIANIEYE